jgi:DNA-binding NtrC family response regulator
LVVEDLDDNRTSLCELLETALGLTVDGAEDGSRGLEMLQAKDYSLVITDLRMPKLGGMKMIEQIQAKKIPVTIIVTTGHGSIKDAVEAMRMGAYDFLTKPPDPQHLILLVQRALKERALRDEVAALRAQLQDQHAFQNVLSKSAKMHDLFDLIGNIAETTSTVLILGETGTGKEQIAKAIHQASGEKRSGQFVAVNCAAVPESLLESELFGHEKGSFTGAIAQRKGRFEQANNGTLFLDEIGDIPLNMQVKLLRVIQERKIERVGGSEPIEIDVRLVAATHRSLDKMVREGTFREDLYYRLNVIRVEIPPLRDRMEDIPLLAAHFAQRYSRGKIPPEIDAEAMRVLLEFNWPGNVRQLENAMERACLTARDGVIHTNDLPPDTMRAGDGTPGKVNPFSVDLERSLPEQLSEITAKFEERYLRRALRKSRGHVGKCAKITGLSRRSITDKISHYAINKDEFKKE